MRNTLQAVFSALPTFARLFRGSVVKGHSKAPVKSLEFYDGEFCPYCRYVREALTELDLDAVIYPMPKGGTRFREKLKRVGGKTKVPFLRDPNTGTELYESEAIVNYLYQEYGLEGAVPPPRMINTSVLATMLRLKNGMFVKPSKKPKKLLELYSFEASPYARLVRETLCELEIPYLLHNVGKESGKPAEWLPPGVRTDYAGTTENRRNLVKRGGKMMVPYLVDPNTGVAMYESAEIRRYLVQTYGA